MGRTRQALSIWAGGFRALSVNMFSVGLGGHVPLMLDSETQQGCGMAARGPEWGS